jgi:hypothetical protein
VDALNYFVAIETALVGGKVLIPNTIESRGLVVAGVLVSAVWYMMGAEDRYLVRLYRSQVKKAAQELPDEAWSTTDKRSAYRYVGQVDPYARADLEASESRDEKEKQKTKMQRFLEFEWLSGWRWEPVNTTRLAALFPLLVLILWTIVLFTMPPQASVLE